MLRPKYNKAIEETKFMAIEPSIIQEVPDSLFVFAQLAFAPALLSRLEEGVLAAPRGLDDEDEDIDEDDEDEDEDDDDEDFDEDDEEDEDDDLEDDDEDLDDEEDDEDKDED